MAFFPLFSAFLYKIFHFIFLFLLFYEICLVPPICPSPTPTQSSLVSFFLLFAGGPSIQEGATLIVGDERGDEEAPLPPPQPPTTAWWHDPAPPSGGASGGGGSRFFRFVITRDGFCSWCCCPMTPLSSFSSCSSVPFFFFFLARSSRLLKLLQHWSWWSWCDWLCADLFSLWEEGGLLKNKIIFSFLMILIYFCII